MIEDALIRATAVYIRKGRVQVEGYTQTRHGKPVQVRDYTRSEIRSLTADQIASLLTNRDASPKLKIALINEYTRRGGGDPTVQIGPPSRLRGRKRGGPKMTAERRRNLPSEQFGLPETRKYPLDTRGRAANAKARARQMLNRGEITQEQYDMIVQRADHALGNNIRRRRRRRKRRAVSG